MDRRRGPQVELVGNPEFLREGFPVQDTLRPDRLVVGVSSERGETVMREVYAPLLDAGTPMVVTDAATAQLRGWRRTLPRHEDQLHQRDGAGV